MWSCAELGTVQKLLEQERSEQGAYLVLYMFAKKLVNWNLCGITM